MVTQNQAVGLDRLRIIKVSYSHDQVRLLLAFDIQGNFLDGYAEGLSNDQLFNVNGIHLPLLMCCLPYSKNKTGVY